MIRINTLYGFLRDLFRQHKIHRSAKTVQIRPRSLLSLYTVLFFRRKSSLDGNRYRIFRQFYISGCPKINQFQLSIIVKHQIVNADITIDQSCFMDITKRMDHRLHQRKHFISRHFSICPDIISHSCTLDVFHHDIGSMIFLKKITHRDDTRQFHKAGQASCLFQKIFFSLFKLQFIFSPRHYFTQNVRTFLGIFYLFFYHMIPPR